MGVTVNGFTLNVWGSEVFHFESMKCTLQSKVLNAQKEQQTITVPNPTFIHRNPTTKYVSRTEDLDGEKIEVASSCTQDGSDPGSIVSMKPTEDSTKIKTLGSCILNVEFCQ
ncbi:unnamed protein product [Porites evermanni]|uniref:Uncharacterized protein n=1 Tax=Porites evermanni TaxID=104178 RepID=A0ABN8MQP8_9CNID|nr:unnamed protein product [Porites evermanni]